MHTYAYLKFLMSVLGYIGLQIYPEGYPLG